MRKNQPYRERNGPVRESVTVRWEIVRESDRSAIVALKIPPSFQKIPPKSTVHSSALKILRFFLARQKAPPLFHKNYARYYFSARRRLEVDNFKVLIIIPENGTMTTVFGKPKKSATQPQVGRWSLLNLPLTHRTTTTLLLVSRPSNSTTMQELVANDGGDSSDDGNNGGNGGDGRGRKIGWWPGEIHCHIMWRQLRATATTTDEFGKFFCEIVPLNQNECLLTFV